MDGELNNLVSSRSADRMASLADGYLDKHSTVIDAVTLAFNLMEQANGRPVTAALHWLSKELFLFVGLPDEARSRILESEM